MENYFLGLPDGRLPSFRSAESLCLALPPPPSPPCSTLILFLIVLKALDTILHYAISIISYYMTYFLQIPGLLN